MGDRECAGSIGLGAGVSESWDAWFAAFSNPAEAASCRRRKIHGFETPAGVSKRVVDHRYLYEAFGFTGYEALAARNYCRAVLIWETMLTTGRASELEIEFGRQMVRYFKRILYKLTALNRVQYGAGYNREIVFAVYQSERVPVPPFQSSDRLEIKSRVGGPYIGENEMVYFQSVPFPRFGRRPTLAEYDARRDPGQMDRYRFGIYGNSAFG